MKPITKDVFEIVTAIVCQKLEEGFVPWKQPWKNLGPPRNLVTQRPYRGINHLLLTAAGYPSNEFLTFKQAQDIGARIKKGEKANLVVLWLWVKEDEARKMQEVKGRVTPFLRYYFVFNASQCTGLPERASPLSFTELDSTEKCEKIIVEMPNRPKIVHNENEAYYHPLADFINVPKKELFESPQGYYATLYHELIHSTGYETRLNRKEIMEDTHFGSDLYSIEELTAEIGACYLTSYVGIATNGLTNNVAYIRGWLKRLKDDKKFIVYASAHAQKACDYILGITHSENELVDLIKAGP